MRGERRILSLFGNEFNKSNNTGARERYGPVTLRGLVKNN